MKKKLICCFVCASMVFSMGTVGFAADTQTAASSQEQRDTDSGTNEETFDLYKSLKPVTVSITKDIFFDFDSQDTTEIEQYIKETVDPGFNPVYFNKSVIDSGKAFGQGLIVYTYTIGDIQTNVKYKVSVVKGKATKISAIGTPIYLTEEAPSLKPTITPDLFKKTAAGNSNYTEYGFEVTDQHVFYKQNPVTGTAYVQVLTDYHSNTYGSASDVYTYILDESEIQK